MSESTPALAAAPAPDDPKKRLREKVDKLLASEPRKSESSLRQNGRTLKYTAVAQFMPLTAGGVDAQRGEPQAAVFCVSYTVAERQAAAAVLCVQRRAGLGVGVAAPGRARPQAGGHPRRRHDAAAPYAVQDNPLTWLEQFDLVFIDPPHTGYSIALNDEARKKLFSVDGDADALAEVVRVWLARHKRFGSALYLAGESYGTTRGAAIADKLQDHGRVAAGLDPGVVRDGSAVAGVRAGNDLPYALFLPAFANVAQFHGRLSGPIAASPQAARAAAEAFVNEEYLAALHAGARLDARTRARIEKRLAELTGLPRALVQEKNLRISDETFFFELLRDIGRIVGRLEARVTGPMAASRTRTWEFDPGIEALNAPYTMASMAYFGAAGHCRRYALRGAHFEVNKTWNWNRGEAKGNSFGSTGPDLARALRRNPHLRVLVASGRYDLGTPYSASDWSLAQLDAPADVLARVTHRYYDAGHMMYTRSADLKQLKDDLAGWIAEK